MKSPQYIEIGRYIISYESVVTKVIPYVVGLLVLTRCFKFSSAIAGQDVMDDEQDSAVIGDGLAETAQDEEASNGDGDQIISHWNISEYLPPVVQEYFLIVAGEFVYKPVQFRAEYHEKKRAERQEEERKARRLSQGFSQPGYSKSKTVLLGPSTRTRILLLPIISNADCKTF